MGGYVAVYRLEMRLGAEESNPYLLIQSQSSCHWTSPQFQRAVFYHAQYNPSRGRHIIIALRHSCSSFYISRYASPVVSI